MNYLRYIPHALAVFVSAVFIDSLRYKFTDHEKTVVIFGKLNDWAATIGFPGLFSHSGLFSQYVIGSGELVAAALLMLGIVPALRRLQLVGAGIALVLMTGAIYFHLFTPLGTDPNNDGGGLFVAACLVWVASLTVVVVRSVEHMRMLRTR